MDRVWIQSLEVNLESAFRNLKSAVLRCVMFLGVLIEEPEGSYLAETDSDGR